MSHRNYKPKNRLNNDFHRENIKSSIRPESSLSAGWKSTLKEICLENARKRRMLVHMKKRRGDVSSFMDNRAGDAEDAGGTASDMTSAVSGIATSSCNVGDTARKLVEEQLRFRRVGVMPSPEASASTSTAGPSIQHSSPLPQTSIGNGSAVPLQSFPFTPKNSAPHQGALSSYTTPTSGNYPLNVNLFPTYPSHQYQHQHEQEIKAINFIREDELYELMQEVEEELRKESQIFMEEEMAAFEAQQAQEAQCIHAQIEEYERWNDENAMNEN